MGITVNGPSGIDTQSLIDQLVELERNKVRRVESDKKAYQLKIDAYTKFKSLLSDLRTRASSLSKISSFDLFTTKSSNDKAVTITGGTGSVDAKYDVRVFQLANNEKMISSEGKITSQTETLQSMGIGVGEISIDGVTITIDEDDTIQDLRSKINNATDENGKKLNVTASVLKVADNDFRLVLTAKESGSNGVSYKDITGSTLQDLGIITNAGGDKGNINQKLSSSTDVLSSFNSLATGLSIQFSGTDHDGRAVSGTFVKRAGSTIDDFLKDIENSFHGTVNASFDDSGNLVLEDKITGTSKLSVTSLSVGATEHTISTTVIGDEGKGVLAAGKDAYFSVENIFMSSSKNSASGFVNGATFELNGLSPDEPVTVELKRDIDGIKKKFQDLVDAYNALVRFRNDSTKRANPDDANSTKGALAGDSTIGTIVSQVNAFFKQQFTALEGSAFNNFTMLGLKTDTQSGELQIDSDMFKKAIDTNFDDVVRLFTTTGTSTNPAISMGRQTADTKAGNYILEEIDSEHFRIQLQGDSNWYISDARVGEIISFSDGPAKGLSLTAAVGSIGSGTATFSLSKGLASILDENITKLTDAREGLVTLRQDAWRRDIKYADERIDKLNDRIENYRLRLVKQFSDMEQALNNLQTQSSQMLSSLSWY